MRRVYSEVQRRPSYWAKSVCFRVAGVGNELIPPSLSPYAFKTPLQVLVVQSFFVLKM